MRTITLYILLAVMTLTALTGCGSPAATAAEVMGTASGEPSEPEAPAYADTLFDPTYVHTIDILAPEEGQWDSFIASCTSKEYMRCDLVIDGELFQGAAIRGKGNSSMQRSRATGKYSFKVEFDHYGEETFRGLDKLGLNNLVVDDACLRDYITYRMMDRFGVPSPLCSYAFVTVNGEDWGFYLAVEAVEDSFLARNYGPDCGDLYKPDDLNQGGGFGMGRSDDVKLKYIDDDPASYPNIFGSAKTKVTHAEQIRLIDALRRLSAGEDIPEVVDTEAMLRYLAVHTFVCNGDSYTGSSAHNYYLYVTPEGRLSMIPWDYNEAFGDFGSFGGMASVVNDPIDSPVTSGGLADRPLVAWVFADETYIARYHALYGEFLTQTADSGWLERELASARALIAPYVARDPRSFTTYEAFGKAADELALFFGLRAQSVRGQLEGTIPSTAEGQAADRSALVDASALGSAGGSSGGMGGPSGGPSGAPSGRASE